MSSDKLMIEMTCEEFRQREQQTTKLAEELDELRKKLATMRKIGDEEITGGRMAFADWKKRSKQFTDLYGRFGQSHLGAIETACQAAYKAGERDARRYRWLRAQHWNDNTIAAVRWPKDAMRLGHDAPSGERLDAAIDEAILNAGVTGSGEKV